MYVHMTGKWMFVKLKDELDSFHMTILDNAEILRVA